MEFEEMLELEASKEDSKGAVVTTYNKERGLMGRAKPILADLTRLEQKATDLVGQATAIEILSPGEKDEAITLSGELQTLSKDVEKKCNDFVTPFRKVINAINGPKKKITEATKRAKSILNQKIFNYKKQEEIDQAKQQKIIDEGVAKVQEQLKAQAKKLGIEAPKVTAIKAPKPKSIIRGSSGATLYSRGTWKCDIVDPDKVPMALLDENGKERFRLCIPSQTLLNKAVKMGERNIPGCKIYKKETGVTRAV